ncbi:MAG: hypothetical protein CMF70_03340 [Magnetovibrio sp.]|nr:hypothetical protein [Magnetovibrio sp.]
MIDEVRVAAHYGKSNLYQQIEIGLLSLGLNLGSVGTDDLVFVDNFHIGGDRATQFIADNLKLDTGKTILDIGCGIGGPARYMAKNRGCRVHGVDLTKNYIETGLKLNALVNLNDMVNLHQGTALNLPFGNSSFDGVYMIHVGMNIEKKDQLMKESYRVVKQGNFFVIFDVMKCKGREVVYPLPWADRCEESAVDTLKSYSDSLLAAGFSIVKKEEKNQFARTFFEGVISNMDSNRKRAFGLQLLMGENARAKIMNIYKQIQDKILSPVLLVAKK